MLAASPDGAKRRGAGLLATARGRRFLFAALYFTEGAPIGFLWWTLPVVLRDAGIEHDRIGSLLAALALMWALKFLWAPLVDVLRGPRWTHRGWIVSAQVAMAATLAPFAWIEPVEWLGAWSTLLLVHALAAATQDVAIDALAIESAKHGEHGSLNAWMQAGMLAGRSLFGGAAIAMYDRVGHAGLVVALAVTILVAGCAAWTLPHAAPRERPSLGDFGRTLAAVAREKRTWLGLGFAATAGAGFESVGAFAGPWLTDGGATKTEVGVFIGVGAAASTLVGGFVGGRLVDSATGTRGLALTVVFSALTVLVVALVAALNGSPASSMAALVGVYVSIGALTTASYAHFMRLTSPALAGTQFSAFMGATNLCESWSVWSAGRLIRDSGFGASAAIMALASLASLAWLAPLRSRSPRSND